LWCPEWQIKYQEERKDGYQIMAIGNSNVDITNDTANAVSVSSGLKKTSKSGTVSLPILM
jgi:hypothetical protein